MHASGYQTLIFGFFNANCSFSSCSVQHFHLQDETAERKKTDAPSPDDEGTEEPEAKQEGADVDAQAGGDSAPANKGQSSPSKSGRSALSKVRRHTN